MRATLAGFTVGENGHHLDTGNYKGWRMRNFNQLMYWKNYFQKLITIPMSEPYLMISGTPILNSTRSVIIPDVGMLTTAPYIVSSRLGVTMLHVGEQHLNVCFGSAGNS